MSRAPALLLAAALAAFAAGPRALAEQTAPRGARAAGALPPGASSEDPDSARWKAAPDDPLRGFEDGAEGWKIRTEEGYSDASATEAWASEGKKSLALPVSFPETAVLEKRSGVGPYRWVTIDVRVPADAPRGITAAFFFKGKDGLWFDQVLTREPILPGSVRTLHVDLRERTAPMVPKGHLGAWGELAARDVDTMGLMLMCPSRWKGEVQVDNLRGWTLEGPDTRTLRVLNLSPGPSPTVQYGLYEVSFELSRSFSNPFDPDEISVDASFSGPGIDPVVVPAFYYQDYRRERTLTGEVLTPIGPGQWRVRFCPTRPGRYRYFLEATAGGADGGRVTTPVMEFECAASKHPGFVRVSGRDPWCFELDSGAWFYPIGHNVRSPTDSRCSQILGRDTPPDEGTFLYDRVIPRMAAGGENFIEVWMSSWWLAIEWLSTWKGYHGLGVYSLENAWKLDYVLELARRNGLRVHLVIDNHGKYSTWCDEEWEFSPLNWRNRRSGGLLSCPEEFFGRTIQWSAVTGEAKERYDKAWALYERRIRYIMARWGAYPTVMGFEIISELDLIGSRGEFGNTDGPREWHRRAIDCIHKYDPNRHLLTTHYCGDFTNTDPEMARMKGIDYVVGDAYRFDHEPFARLALQTDLGRQGEAKPGWSSYGKPFMITEYGGSPFGTGEDGLVADLHAGLWAGYMTRAAGTPLLWWFELIDRRELYSHYAALAAFHEGEDRRGKKLAPRDATPEGPGELGLSAMILASDREGYAWVYAREPMKQMPPAGKGVECRGVVLRIDGLAEGEYDVEVWDTCAGKVLRADERATEGGRLKIELPDFTNDCAVKFGPAGGARGAAPPRSESSAAPPGGAR